MGHFPVLYSDGDALFPVKPNVKSLAHPAPELPTLPLLRKYYCSSSRQPWNNSWLLNADPCNNHSPTPKLSTDISGTDKRQTDTKQIEADLHQTNRWGADRHQTDWWDADWQEEDRWKADWHQADWHQLDWREADWQKPDWHQTHWREAGQEADQPHTDWWETNWQEADWHQADLQRRWDVSLFWVWLRLAAITLLLLLFCDYYLISLSLLNYTHNSKVQ